MNPKEVSGGCYVPNQGSVVSVVWILVEALSSILLFLLRIPTKVLDDQ